MGGAAAPFLCRGALPLATPFFTNDAAAPAFSLPCSPSESSEKESAEFPDITEKEEG